MRIVDHRGPRQLHLIVIWRLNDSLGSRSRSLRKCTVANRRPRTPHPPSYLGPRGTSSNTEADDSSNSPDECQDSEGPTLENGVHVHGSCLRGGRSRKNHTRKAASRTPRTQ